MRIVNIMFKALRIRWNYSAAAAGIIALLYCCPSWGYVPDFRRETIPVSLPNYYEDSLSRYQLLSKKNKQKSKGYQSSDEKEKKSWQDLSPKEKERMRKKYKEWQSLPPDEKQIIRQRMNKLNRMSPQERELHKQLFRQWQNLAPKERKQLQKDLENWEHLSPRQQDSIRRRFMN